MAMYPRSYHNHLDLIRMNPGKQLLQWDGPSPRVTRPLRALPIDERYLSLTTSFPLDDVSQPPLILVKLPLQFAFFIDDELCGREKDPITLTLVLIIYVDLTSSQIETLGLGIPIAFAESNFPVGNKTDGPAGRRKDLPNEAEIKSKCARDLYPAHAFHLFKGVHQSVVLTLLECLYQDVSILGTRELVNNDFDAEVSSQLRTCAKGCGVDRF